jgi:hypothetical protein
MPANPPATHAAGAAASGLALWAVVLIAVLMALAALAAGFVAGRRRPHSFGTGEGGRPLAESSPDELAAGAAADWRRAEAGRPWLSSPGRDKGDTEREAGDTGPAAERARLVASCASLADKLRERQPALFSELTRGLAAVGVTVEDADGERFDEQRHNPIGTEPTADPAADLLVASTVRLGYRDHGAVVRSPDVIVYRATGNGHAD